MSSSEDVFSSALALPASQRARLAHELLASLDDGNDASAEQAWLHEMHKRAQDVDASSIALEDFTAVRERLSKRLTKW